MSPSAAMDSGVFKIYFVLITTMLLIAGVSIAFLRWVLKKDVGHAWASYRGWLVMIPLIMGGVFLGRIAVILGLTLVALAGFKEYARATGLYRDWTMTCVVYLGLIACGVTTFVVDPFLGVPGWYGLYAALPVYVIAAIVAVPIVRNRAAGQLQVIALAIVGFMYIGWMFGHATYLANSSWAYGYLLYLLFAVQINDVSAYVFGKCFGRHPLRSSISPNKTWEGAIGAVAVSMVLPWVLHFSFPHFGTLELLLIGLVVGVGGQLGDLSLSVIKRDIGIKDMGQTIRGHGGVLDRIDSLIYVAPLFFHLSNYYHGIY